MTVENGNGENYEAGQGLDGGDGGTSSVAGLGSAEDQIARAEAKAAEYLDMLQRERASFQNYRRRSEQEIAEAQQFGAAQTLKKLLPVVDDFDRALAAAPEGDPWVEGVLMIDRKLHALLEGEGVTSIESVGKPFDPTLHEAVAYEEGGEGEDVVSEEFARGYRHKDRVLRHAMVKVGKGRSKGRAEGKGDQEAMGKDERN